MVCLMTAVSFSTHLGISIQIHETIAKTKQEALKAQSSEGRAFAILDG